MAQSVIKTVIAGYKAIFENQKEWIKPSFRKPQYDLVWNRDYFFTQNCFSVNILSGRVKLPYFKLLFTPFTVTWSKSIPNHLR